MLTTREKKVGLQQGETRPGPQIDGLSGRGNPRDGRVDEDVEYQR